MILAAVESVIFRLEGSLWWWLSSRF